MRKDVRRRASQTTRCCIKASLGLAATQKVNKTIPILQPAKGEYTTSSPNLLYDYSAVATNSKRGPLEKTREASKQKRT